MTTSTKTITETSNFPIFKGAIYNTSFSTNTALFGTDLTPTNTPTTFRVYYVNSTGNAFPQIQRTNGTNVLQESFPLGNSGNTLSSAAPNTIDFIVGPNDTINFIFPTGTTTGTIKTMIVMEVETAKGYAPIRNN